MRLIILFISTIIIFTGRQSMSSFSYNDRSVTLANLKSGYKLYRNGQPYVIKGANVYDCRHLEDLKNAGANSVRIYTTEGAAEILDSAQKLGLTVTLGIHLALAKTEMNYNDADAVKKQFERVKKEILSFKDHPALLLWGIGNETGKHLTHEVHDLYSVYNCWKAINEIAKMIHQVDPNHPTTTMLNAEPGKLRHLAMTLCKDIDLVSYNAFKELFNFGKPIKRNLARAPYLLSEYGAYAYWDGKQTDWYSSIEQSSFEKAKFIEKQFKYIVNDSTYCIGSYLFIWAHKLEYTDTWFSLYTEKGDKTEIVNAVSAMWRGKTPPASDASITGLRIGNKISQQNIYLEGNAKYTVEVETSKPLLPSDSIYFYIMKDDIDLEEATQHSIRKETVQQGSIKFNSNGNNHLPSTRQAFTFITPQPTGAYRLFLFRKNQQGIIFTHNICFYVLN